MRRCLFTFCSTMSLLLFLAVVVLWVRSKTHAVEVSWTRWAEGPSGYTLRSAQIGGSDGMVWASFERRTSDRTTGSKLKNAMPEGFRFKETPSRMLAMMQASILRDFHLEKRVRQFGPMNISTTRSALCPAWAIALFLAITPAAWTASFAHRRIRSRARSRAGQCPTCGYDLRATPDRCPECGTKRTS